MALDDLLARRTWRFVFWSAFWAVAPLVSFAADCLELVGRLPPHGPANAVAVSGDLAVIGSGPVLQVLDISNPDRPELLGELELPGVVSGIEMSGHHAVATAGSAGLRVIDVAVPSNPIEVGFFSTQGVANDLALSGGFAFVAESGGLWVIDIGLPSAPKPVGHHRTAEAAHGVAVAGGRAFVATVGHRGGLYVFDVGNPSAPIELGYLRTGIFNYDVAVFEAHAFVTESNRGLVVVDVSVPGTPVEIAALDLNGGTNGVLVRDGLAYTVDGSNLHIVDVSTPSNPWKVGSLRILDRPVDLAISNHIAFVAGSSEGLRVIDSSNASNPTEIGFFDTPGLAYGVTVAEDLAYVVEQGSGIRIIDVGSPSAPFEIGTFAATHPSDVVVSGDLAFVGDGDKGLQIVDVSTPSAPVEIGRLDPGGHTWRIAVSGSFVFVADPYNRFRVIDVSVPSAPVEVASLEIDGRPSDVQLSGSIAYVTDSYYGLRVIDVSSPLAPVEIGAVRTTNARQAFVSGEWVYVADGTGGLRVFDVTVPSQPTEIDSISIVGNANTVEVSRRFAYIDLAYDPSIVLIDEAGKSTSRLHCVLDLPGYATGLTISNNLVFVTDSIAGLSIFRPLERRYWLDNAANQPGLFGSQWRTDVVAKNVGRSQASVEFALFGPDGTTHLDATIQPGAQRAFEDIVGLMGYEGKGCLRVTSDEPLEIAGRIYNLAGDGTFGQSVEAYEQSRALGQGDVVTLLQLRQMVGEYRTNLSLANTGTEPATVRTRLFTSGGNQLVEYSLDIDAHRLVQDPQPFKNRAGQPNLGWGFAEVEVLSGSGILVSASVVDSQTNDATTIPFRR